MERSKAPGIFLMRIIVGWGFLFAGLDKFLDLAGTGKPFSAAGFLKFGTGGTWVGIVSADPNTPVIVNPTHDFWVGLAGNPQVVDVINFLVVFGEIAIGAALILGLATRFAAVMGVLMMALFYIASWDFGHGLVNEQLMYGIATLFLGYVGAGHYYGLDSIVERSEAVKRAPRLRLVLS